MLLVLSVVTSSARPSNEASSTIADADAGDAGIGSGLVACSTARARAARDVTGVDEAGASQRVELEAAGPGSRDHRYGRGPRRGLERRIRKWVIALKTGK